MLPFFRKIRWRLAQNNQFFKYSRYAIGEIVLVVIGILIALYINNWNEEKKSNIKTIELFAEVQRDLLSKIYSISETILLQSRRDSIMSVILNYQLTVEDYIEKPELYYPIGHIDGPSLSNHGFSKLSSNIDTISDKYQGVYDTLKIIFDRYQSNMERWKDCNDLATYNNNYFSENYKYWIHNVLRPEDRNQETLSYLINNPVYLNKVFQFQANFYDQNWYQSLADCVNIYMRLAQITGIKELSETYLRTAETSLEEYTGIYAWTDKNVMTDPSNRVITVVDRALKYHFDHYIFYEVKKDSFVRRHGNTLFFKRDSSGQIIGATRYTNLMFHELEKVN